MLLIRRRAVVPLWQQVGDVISLGRVADGRVGDDQVTVVL
jgi:hypothetical protein